MRIFVSAGEPSGDLHGSNLIRAMHQVDPALDLVGFGGDRMTQAGCKLLYPLCQHAVTGFVPVLAEASLFLKLIWQADRYFLKNRPDAVVLIDYPGFNWWIARRAHQHKIPVYYFVPPQIWAWASWRVAKMRRFVDHVLCSLPFEKDWYLERGVAADYVGHPYFDELPTQRLDIDFQKHQRTLGGTIIGLLPGSRNQELAYNLPTLLRAAEQIHAARPETRFLVACYKSAHYDLVQTALHARPMPFVQPHLGRTPEIIDLSHACIAVSGSVSLELLYRAKPCVTLYRAPAFLLFLSRYLKKPGYISLVNLLANEELSPEFLSDQCEAAGVSRRMIEWLHHPIACEQIRTKLDHLRREAARPGACERSARFILDRVAGINSGRKRNAA
jgi:lipid-A-disaccharide synthase